MRSVWRKVGSSPYSEGKQFGRDGLGCRFVSELEIYSASVTEGDLQCRWVAGVGERV